MYLLELVSSPSERLGEIGEKTIKKIIKQ